MTISVVETEHLRSFPSSSAGIAPQHLLGGDRLVALLVNVDGGQVIEPCRMEATVLYYVIEGKGHLRVETEQTELQAGSLVLVPPGTTRTISAAEPMRLLAVKAA